MFLNGDRYKKVDLGHFRGLHGGIYQKVKDINQDNFEYGSI